MSARQLKRPRKRKSKHKKIKQHLNKRSAFPEHSSIERAANKQPRSKRTSAISANSATRTSTTPALPIRPCADARDSGRDEETPMHTSYHAYHKFMHSKTHAWHTDSYTLVHIPTHAYTLIHLIHTPIHTLMSRAHTPCTHIIDAYDGCARTTKSDVCTPPPPCMREPSPN